MLAGQQPLCPFRESMIRLSLGFTDFLLHFNKRLELVNCCSRTRMPSGHAKRAVILGEDLLQLVRVARRVPFFFLRACSTAPFNMTLAIEALSLGVSFKNSCFSFSKSSPAKE